MLFQKKNKQGSEEGGGGGEEGWAYKFWKKLRNFHCFTLPLEIPKKTNLHPWIPQSCIRSLWNSKTNIQQRRPMMETPHYFFGAIALLYPLYCIDDSSLKNAAESFTVTLTLGGYESAILPFFWPFFLGHLWKFHFFLTNPWKFHMLFLWYIWKFHNPQSPVFFFFLE